MKLFEDFDNPKFKDKELSLKEKDVVRGLIVLTQVGLNKIKRAKTYGDFDKIVTFIDDKFEAFEDEELTEENSEEYVKYIDQMASDLTTL